MAENPDAIRPFYASWERYQARMVEAIRDLTPDQLALRGGPDQMPIWALMGHLAGARVYWLCSVFGEPGAATTPFPNPATEPGWEDVPEHPRSAAELVTALETTWAIVDRCLGSWTPATLAETVARPGTDQRHTRQSVIIRLLAHDAYHSGEISQVLGVNGLPQLDLWARPTAP